MLRFNPPMLPSLFLLALYSVSTAHAAGITGSLRLLNCLPASPDEVYVIIRGQSSNITRFNATSLTKIRDGVVDLSFSVELPEDIARQEYFLLIPAVPEECNILTGAKWMPRALNISNSSVPLENQEFLFTAGIEVDLKTVTDELLGATNLELVLNNYDPHTEGEKQSSYLRFGSSSYPIQDIPRQDFDLDLCSSWFCPDVGDASYFVNNLRSTRLTATPNGDKIHVTLVLDDAPEGLKGIYYPGSFDNVAPDFGIHNMRVNANLIFKQTTVAPGITVAFEDVSLTGEIRSGGVCKIFGFNICDSFFSAEDRILDALNSAAKEAVSSNLLDQYISDGIGSYVKELAQGLEVIVSDFAVYNGKLFGLFDLNLGRKHRRNRRRLQYRQRSSPAS